MTDRAPRSRVRVVVTDDSAFMRRLLADGLNEHGFTVVGTAASGDEALVLCERHKPDVLTLDLAMPGLDGLGVLRALGGTASPVPVIVVSAFSPAHGARAVDALAAGAVELVAKPAVGEPLAAFLAELAEKTLLASRARPAFSRNGGPARTATVPTRPAPRQVGVKTQRRAVLIACSTGGPRALAELVPRLPAPLGEGTAIVQHMPSGFTASLAERLDRTSALDVREAAEGQFLSPGSVLIAPGGRHLRLKADRTAYLSDEPAVGGLKPRADLTIRDAARAYRERLLLVVLTGMGRDGLEGAREVKRHGGRVICEAESTCVVYGMPRAVVDANLADAVVPLDAMAEAIAEEAGR